MGTRTSGFTLRQSPDGVADGAPLDGTTAVAVTFNSQPVWVDRVGNLSLQVSCPATGTPNGSFAIQGCNDASNEESLGKPDTNLKNWSTLTFFDEAAGANAQTKAVAGAQSFMVSIAALTPRWVRFVWTNTSGTANLTVRAEVKAQS